MKDESVSVQRLCFFGTEVRAIRNEVVRLRVAESCLFVMCGTILLILTSLNHDLVPVCVIIFPE